MFFSVFYFRLKKTIENQYVTCYIKIKSIILNCELFDQILSENNKIEFLEN